MADTAQWVLGLRSQLRQSIGPAWRIGQQRGKTKLDVRFKDGSRQTAVLPFPWLPAQSRSIQDAVEHIARTVAAGHSLSDALKQIRGNTPAPPSGGSTAGIELLDVWRSFGDFKQRSGAIKPSTWRVDYAATAKRLAEVAEGSSNAKDLLTAVGERWAPGARRRQIAVQHVAAMLRWACDEDKLPADRWTPPSSLRRYVGEAVETKEPTHPLKDGQILELLDALPKDAPGQRWVFVLQLLAAYGLRPVEVLHLQSRGDDSLWCTYRKRSGGGTTQPRQLRALHPEWERDWSLRERLAASEPMPPFGGGVADAARRYLCRQEAWTPLAKAGITLYGFRHGWALRAHQDYSLAPRFAAALMGHSVDTHQRVYGTWTDADTIDSALEKGRILRERSRGA
jgi:integrase